MNLNQIYPVLLQAARQWWDDNPFRLGAALAYYGAFSLAPVLVIAVAVAGFVFGEAAARGQLVQQLEQTVGTTVARAIAEILHTANVQGRGLWATILGVGTLFFAATGVLTQVQDALNLIWRVQVKEGRGLLAVVQDRLWSFFLILLLGALLLTVMVANAVLASLSAYLGPEVLPGGVYLWRGLNFAISFGLLTILFAMTYRILPDAEILWKDVWIGAAVTALLFLLGNWLIGFYLSTSGTASAYGAAGSLVIILVWVYYSSQVFLFGAEVTQAFANAQGRHLQPTPNAEAVANQRPA